MTHFKMAIAAASFMTLTIAGVTEAQQRDYVPGKKLEMSPDYITGRLDNGLTYFVRKNNYPENKVSMHMALHSGSTSENDREQGLAHFQEHMAFKGTRDFPGNSLITGLEAKGIRFGQFLNAYTSFDETVFMVEVPSDQFDLGMDVLYNWAGEIENNAEPMEKERGVVLEEWRLGLDANRRSSEAFYDVLLAGSVYPKRFPIGKEEVLKTFTHDDLKNFHDKWFRPDLMAIIVVGDVDVEKTVAEIKARFSSLKNPENAPARPDTTIPIHSDTKVSVFTEPEITGTQVRIIYKKPWKWMETEADFRDMVVKTLYGNMLNERLKEIARQPGAPFMDPIAARFSMVPGTEFFQVSANSATGQVAPAYKAAVQELERARRFGFTQGELDRAKAKYINMYEPFYMERDKTPSAQWVSDVERHFFGREPLTGIEFHYEILPEMMKTITLADIEKAGDEMITGKGRVISLVGPQKEGLVYPTEQELVAELDNAANLKLEPYDDGKQITALMDKTPKAGKIVSEKHLDRIGVTVLELSNGAKAVLKPTDFQNDEIYFYAISEGGMSLYGPKDDMSLRFATEIVKESGIGGFAKRDLDKYFAGKSVSLRSEIDDYTEYMYGYYGDRYATDMFQTIYLNFTRPAFDAKAFDALMTRMRQSYEHYTDDPRNYFQVEMEKAMAGNSSRILPYPDPARLGEVDMKRAEKIYKERFGNASDFLFLFVGSFTVDKIKPLIETYIASLPSAGKKETARPLGIETLQGPVEKVYYKGTDEKVDVAMQFVQPAVFDPREEYNLGGFSEILSMRMFESLRQEMNGVYGVRTRLTLNRAPQSDSRTLLSFGTNVEAYEQLYKRALLETQKLIDEGPTQDEVNNLIKKRRVAIGESLRDNRYWMKELRNAFLYGEDPENALNKQQWIEEFDRENIREAGKRNVDLESVRRFILLPEKMKP